MSDEELKIKHWHKLAAEEFAQTWNKFLPKDIKKDDATWMTAAQVYELSKVIAKYDSLNWSDK
jgi:hypothetical protein